MKKNTVIGRCVDISSEGKGIIKFFNETIFVDALLLDETAEIEILYRKKGVAFGKIVRLIEKSKERINPLCLISTSCGGCCFQNASYEYELKYKKHKVEEDLKRIGGISFPVNDVIGMDNPYHYRNKIQVPFSHDGRDIVYGFYKANTHKIISTDECNIEDVRAKEILKEIKYLMKSMKIPPYIEDAGYGLIRHVLIRTSLHFNEVMVVLVTTKEQFPSRNNFVKALVNKFKYISTVVQNINPRDTNVILGEKERVLYGKGYIMDSILGITFSISSKSFFQVNPYQVEKLYSKAFEFASLNKDDVLLDAYSGIGTIGLIASKQVKKVVQVEKELSSVKNALESIKRNKIDNVEVINQDCTEYLLNTKDKYDVVIMDPPRKGSTKEFINALISSSVKRIIYISCDPATLSRDLSYFKDKYEIKVIQPVDMFPRSFH
ncbi:MAG: 23S rRNA (uracil(1939)-C(5))-methyltransferase RlmD, partial [Bacilli bacterium]